MILKIFFLLILFVEVELFFKVFNGYGRLFEEMDNLVDWKGEIDNVEYRIGLSEVYVFLFS